MTAVALAHTEVFGTIDDVAVAKGELVEALPPTGTAVLNADDDRVAAMAAAPTAPVLTYGVDRGDVRAEGVVLDDELRPPFAWRRPGATTRCGLAVRGGHKAANARRPRPRGAGVRRRPRRRGRRPAVGLAVAVADGARRSPSGAVVLNDAYNANPTSMAAALDALDDLPAERRTAVLGPMAELGAEAGPSTAGWPSGPRSSASG